MDSKKYIAIDVHQAAITVAVRDATGKLVMESTIQTKAATILDFIHGLRGTLWVTFEEGTSAAWLHDLLKPHVDKVLASARRQSAGPAPSFSSSRDATRSTNRAFHELDDLGAP